LYRVQHRSAEISSNNGEIRCGKRGSNDNRDDDDGGGGIYCGDSQIYGSDSSRSENHH